MDFEKSNLVPKSNIRDFDLNEPCMEMLDFDTENECSQLIHMNTDPQKDTEVDCAKDMNMNLLSGGDNEVHQSSAVAAGSVIVANDSVVAVGASDDNDARHLQTRVYITSISCEPDGTARGRDLLGGRRRYRRRAGAALMQSDPLRYCTNYYCRTRKTPLWRKGPLGPKTLCNACGIDYMKQVTKGGSGVTIVPDATLVPATIDDDVFSSTAIPTERE